MVDETIEQRARAAEREEHARQEAQVLRRLRWGGRKGYSLAQLTRSLEWPGDGAGIPAVLRRLVEDGRAVQVGQRWYLPHQIHWAPDPPPAADPTPVPDALSGTLSPRLASVYQDIQANPGTRAIEVCDRNGLTYNAASAAVRRLKSLGLVRSQSGSLYVAQKPPEASEAPVVKAKTAQKEAEALRGRVAKLEADLDEARAAALDARTEAAAALTEVLEAILAVCPPPATASGSTDPQGAVLAALRCMTTMRGAVEEHLAPLEHESPADAIVRCAREVEALRARVAELEAGPGVATSDAQDGERELPEGAPDPGPCPEGYIDRSVLIWADQDGWVTASSSELRQDSEAPVLAPGSAIRVRVRLRVPRAPEVPVLDLRSGAPCFKETA